jgi:hypothetical protein
LNYKGKANKNSQKAHSNSVLFENVQNVGFWGLFRVDMVFFNDFFVKFSLKLLTNHCLHDKIKKNISQKVHFMRNKGIN